MDVKLYIKDYGLQTYTPLDLFKDEKIDLNLAIKNLNQAIKKLQKIKGHEAFVDRNLIRIFDIKTTLINALVWVKTD